MAASSKGSAADFDSTKEVKVNMSFLFYFDYKFCLGWTIKNTFVFGWLLLTVININNLNTLTRNSQNNVARWFYKID